MYMYCMLKHAQMNQTQGRKVQTLIRPNKIKLDAKQLYNSPANITHSYHVIKQAGKKKKKKLPARLKYYGLGSMQG